jgi:hypothetical protein
MKLTKVRLQKIMNNNGKQTRKKYRKTSRILKHTNTARHKKQFNLRNTTLKQMVNI